jgi:apolipoprotein N-acyltransferase
MTNSALRTPHSAFPQRWLPLLVAAAYVVALTLAFPPFKQAWAVLIFLVPFVKWAFAAPRWRTFLLTGFAAGWGSWFGVLIWLRHIYPPWGWVGLALLSGYLGLYAVAWLAALRWAAPRMRGASRGRRLLGMLALAGWWIVLDWLRSVLFTGFPWLPLAAAFWELPLLLQPIAWTGQWGVTFMIVLFNLGLVCGTGPEVVAGDAQPPRRKIWWPARCGPEMLLPLALFFGAVLLSLHLLSSKQRAEVRLLRAGIVQPWTPPLLKWDPAAEDKNRDTLLALTQTFAYRDGSRNNVDLILWPEAALAYEFQGARAEPNRQALNQIVNKLGVPLMFGGIGEAPPRPGESASPGVVDGVFFTRPGAGFAGEVYAKRHLVPFGEYVPLRNWLPFLGKVVPIDADTVPGDRAVTIPLTLGGGRTVHAGPLVCYEDVFSYLARDQVRAGADFLVVVTNDAWYGKGGGALQHAAHSVLRAIETRRPVVRCGNDGWSGFIDQDGDAFPLEKNGRTIERGWILTAHGTTYFQGAGALYLYTNPQFDGVETFYVRYGDWFVGFSALLALAGWFSLVSKRQ